MSGTPVRVFGLAALATALLAGCGPAPCMEGEGIVPGQGLIVDGAPLCVGGSAAAMAEALGPPPSSRDLGALGIAFGHPERSLSGFLSAPDGLVTGLTVTSGYAGRTAGGTGIGSVEADVRGDLGEPLVDPFAGAWVYREQGITLEWQEGAVVRVQIFDPTAM